MQWNLVSKTKSWILVQNLNPTGAAKCWEALRISTSQAGKIHKVHQSVVQSFIPVCPGHELFLGITKIYFCASSFINFDLGAETCTLTFSWIPILLLALDPDVFSTGWFSLIWTFRFVLQSDRPLVRSDGPEEAGPNVWDWDEGKIKEVLTAAAITI